MKLDRDVMKNIFRMTGDGILVRVDVSRECETFKYASRFQVAL